MVVRMPLTCCRSFDKDFCDVFSHFKDRYLYWTQVCLW